ncbi:MAG: VOC family protein [Hyphomicrobiales bacterium]
MGNPVVHFEIMAPNAEKARQFYGELFGWQMQVLPPEMDYTHVKQEPGGIGGGIGEDAGRPGQRVIVYVQVDDPQAYLDRAVAMGGRVLQPVMEIPGVVTTAQFADPRGIIVGLVKG